MKFLPMLAFHGHFGGGGRAALFFIAILVIALVLISLPHKSETK